MKTIFSIASPSPKAMDIVNRKEDAPTITQTWEIKRLQPKEYAYHFMKWYEWLRLQAYPDWWKRWSIWYGTHSYPWETITNEEANKRYIEAILPRSEKVANDNPNANSCQQGALISILYNCPSCYANLMNKWVSEKLRVSHSYVCKSWKCEYRQWLRNRREAERKLYNTCNWDI